MIVEILATGNEVVDGEVVNSNAAWLAARMRELGFEVRFHSAVPDEAALIADALRRGVGRADLLLVTGGLGPTVDDITLEVAAKTFGRPLELQEDILQGIRAFFQRIGRPLSSNQEKQAWLPRGCVPLRNGVGTAPGAFWVEGTCRLAFFPGVPKEMTEMFQRQFLPQIAELRTGTALARRELHCFGLPEGQLDQMLRPLLDERRQLEGVTVGFRVRFPHIDLRLWSAGSDQAAAEARVAAAVARIRSVVGEFVFGVGEEKLEEVVGALLTRQGKTLATAESCTGGLLANWITDVPGSSRYFLEGAVTYSNAAKVRHLGVSEATLRAHGAVSAEVALEMARGIRAKSGADFGIGITGIAGPEGGTPEKPVGTVHIAVVHPQGEWEQRYLLPFERLRFKQVAAAAALDRVRRILLGE
ncbi:MAG: competence/damage-inducible protein A [bacterium]